MCIRDRFYVDTIDPNKTIREGIDNMLYTLDPYTEYFPEEGHGFPSLFHPFENRNVYFFAHYFWIILLLSLYATFF